MSAEINRNSGGDKLSTETAPVTVVTSTEKMEDDPNPSIRTKNLTPEEGNGHLPPSLGIATIKLSLDAVNVSVMNHTRFAATTISPTELPNMSSTLNSLAETTEVKKIVAAAIMSSEDEYQTDPDAAHDQTSKLRRLLWQDNDVVPVYISEKDVSQDTDPDDPDSHLLIAGRLVGDKFTPHGAPIVDVDPQTGRVKASEINTLDDWKETTPESEWTANKEMIDHFAKRFDGWKLVRINTTPQAGGVAGMLHPAERFISEHNRDEERKIRKGDEGHPIDFRWHTMNGYIDPEVALAHGIDLADPKVIAEYGNPEKPEEGINIFKMTKKRHNIIQGQERPGERFTEMDRKLDAAWTETQAERLRGVLEQPNTVFWIDDQQVFPLTEKILAVNPDAPIIARSHIQYRSDLATDPTSPQYEVVEYLFDNLVGNGNRIDAFLSHRARDEDISEFLPKTADGKVDHRIDDITMYKVATADQSDGLDRPLTPEQKNYYIGRTNEKLIATGQTPIDRTVAHWGQFARFDRAKNIPGVLASYNEAVKNLMADGVPFSKVPEQIIAGFGAPDDPDGMGVLAETRKEIAEKYPHLQDKFKVVRFDYQKDSDQDMAALEGICETGLQLSTAEGCEDKITQLLQHGIPVIVANVGGMPPQIKDGISGILVEPHDHKTIGRHLADLHMNREKLAEMSSNAKEYVNPEYTTPANIRDMLGIAVLVKEKRNEIPNMVRTIREAKGEQHPFVKELVVKEFENTKDAETSIPVIEVPVTVSESTIFETPPAQN